MEEKKGFSKKLDAFFAGKGFYIVLLLCAVLVGTSFWLMGRGSRADVENAPVKESEITASAEETTPPQGSVAVMGPEDESLPLGTGVLPAAAGEELPEAQAPAVQEKLPQVQTAAEETPETFIRPVSGALLRGFSMETLSYDRTMADWRVHRGWDMAGSAGETVAAVSGGTVTAVYEDDLLGTVVEIDHGGGFKTLYAHCSSISVSVGQQVYQGQKIGAVGSTGRSTGAHCHFEIFKNGGNVNPASYL